MAFMDKLSSMAKNAADKTSEVMETSKLNSKINESKNKISADKTQIGEYYWTKYESGEILAAEVMALCAAIKAENETIEELNREIQRIKTASPPTQASGAASGPAAISCASCGAAIPAGKKFCPECGTPAAPPQPEPGPESVPCSSCGQPVPAGKKFCPECGAAIVAPEPAAEVLVVEPARCVACGEELPEGKKFCPECGAPVPV